MLLLGMSLLVFVPQLRLLTATLTIFYFISEAMRTGQQDDNSTLLKSIPWMILFSILSYVLFKALKPYLDVETFVLVNGVGIFAWIMYYLYSSIIETQVFRKVLPETFNFGIISEIAILILTCAYHYITISLLLPELSFSQMLPYMAFTFVFSAFMRILVILMKTIAPAAALQWVFDLFKKGVIQ